MKTYTTVIDYENNPNYEVRTEKIVNSRNGQEDFRTVYYPVGTAAPAAIPSRKSNPVRKPNSLNLDMDEIAAARNWANSIRSELS